MDGSALCCYCGSRVSCRGSCVGGLVEWKEEVIYTGVGAVEPDDVVILLLIVCILQ